MADAKKILVAQKSNPAVKVFRTQEQIDSSKGEYVPVKGSAPAKAEEKPAAPAKEK